jgi:hypothetical protein
MYEYPKIEKIIEYFEIEYFVIQLIYIISN